MYKCKLKGNQALKQKAIIALATCASMKRTITYKELGSRLGIHHRNVRIVLLEVSKWCIDSNRPILSSLVVSGKGSDVGLPKRGLQSDVRMLLDDELDDFNFYDEQLECYFYQW